MRSGGAQGTAVAQSFGKGQRWLIERCRNATQPPTLRNASLTCSANGALCSAKRGTALIEYRRKCREVPRRMQQNLGGFAKQPQQMLTGLGVQSSITAFELGGNCLRANDRFSAGEIFADVQRWFTRVRARRGFRGDPALEHRR